MFYKSDIIFYVLKYLIKIQWFQVRLGTNKRENTIGYKNKKIIKNN